MCDAAGGTVKWGQLPVYLAAELLAGVLAGLIFGAISRRPADPQAGVQPQVQAESAA